MNSREDLIGLIASRTKVIKKIMRSNGREKRSMLSYQKKTIHKNKYETTLQNKQSNSREELLSLSASFHNSLVEYASGMKLKLCKMSNGKNERNGKKAHMKVCPKTPKRTKDKKCHGHSCYTQEERIQKAYMIRKKLHKKTLEINRNKPSSEKDLTALISSSQIPTPRTPRDKACFTPNLKKLHSKRNLGNLFIRNLLQPSCLQKPSKKRNTSRKKFKYSPMVIHTVYGEQEAESIKSKSNSFLGSKMKNPNRTQYSSDRMTQSCSKDLNTKDSLSPDQDTIVLKTDLKNLMLKSEILRNTRLKLRKKGKKEVKKLEISINNQVFGTTCNSFRESRVALSPKNENEESSNSKTSRFVVLENVYSIFDRYD
ncbi:unnamed protein product [Moneuplotes crassus]|uniref:Uncharacterized protein n=1 Tax=Euplotes crassus TaxID=5936 RepID=A0AAD1Y8J6_EUPCR|nr:unnamed protein product [Moneuplotes crassus]